MSGLARGIRGSDFEVDIKGLGLGKMSLFALIKQSQTCRSRSQTAQRRACRVHTASKKMSHGRDEYSSPVRVCMNPVVHSSSNFISRNGNCTPPYAHSFSFLSISKDFNYRAQSI